MKTAIITGVTGQMGSYFAEFLLAKGFRVVGTARRLSVPNKENIGDFIDHENFFYKTMDLGDAHSINTIVEKFRPDYFINCAANSFVGSSWDVPEQHMEFNALGVLRQLEAIRNYSPKTRYVNFGSSEEFGNVQYSPQDEKHPSCSRSPYGASKVAARQLVKVYRESYGLYAIQCWCFNYESPRRGEEFVTRKITKGVARIKHAMDRDEGFEPIELGNMDAQRDWGHALDYVDGVWRMLNQQECMMYIFEEDHGALPDYDDSFIPKEYVLSSGKTHTIRSFVEKAFQYAGIKGFWSEGGLQGNSPLNKQFMTHSSKPNEGALTLVRVNPEFYRPAEVELLLGDSSKIRKDLGWEPKFDLDMLVEDMVKSDIRNYKE